MRGQIRAATVTLRHIQTIEKGGKAYRYLRIPGQPRQRLPDLPPDSPEFLAAYAEEKLGRPIWTHEFPSVADELKEAAKADFIAICALPSPGGDIPAARQGGEQ